MNATHQSYKSPLPQAQAREIESLQGYFHDMIDHCVDYVDVAKSQGRPVVGIMCEFTPREVILAAGAIPVCLCGGSAKTIPAAEQVLPANLCPLIKSTYGYHLSGTNPFLKAADLIVAETTCDGKVKMFELMGSTRAMHVLELPRKLDGTDSLQRWTGEVRRFKDRLEAVFGIQITEEKLRKAAKLMNRERRLRRGLADTMVRNPPPLSGRQLLEFKSVISGLEEDLSRYEQALRVIEEAPLPCSHEKGLIRVLLTGVPVVHGAERVVDLIENSGAVIVAMENCTGLKPILEDVDENAADILAAIAAKYHHLPCSVVTLNSNRPEILRKLAAKFKPDCVIELVWQACLTYDVESHFIRKLAVEELGLPYLKITTDYSPSDSARITSRVEALFETISARNS